MEPPYTLPLPHDWNFFDLIDGLNWLNMVPQIKFFSQM